jgi:sulfoxide reductase heme-binding subunit YedZ
MSQTYQAIGWNRQKRLYDTVLGAGIVVYLALFAGLGFWLHPQATSETLLIRGLGTCALLLLHLVLCIGPLCRLFPSCLPLLYNRRHLGVTTFVLGLAHGTFALVQFHALGDVNPLLSVLLSNPRYDSFAQFPFQPLGLAALLILFLLAATSHDFWLAQLTAPVWKRLHMLVYLAYGLLLAHVTLGVLQAETSPWLAGALGAGMLLVFGLQLLAAQRERALDAPPPSAALTGFIEVCAVTEIPANRARIVTIAGERVAIFRYGGRYGGSDGGQVSALSNVCQHQNGPLGEGRIIDGCVTCPWHGYQYHPATGAAPAPFTEKVPTFRVQVRDGKVWVEPKPQPPGTYVKPTCVKVTAAGVV